MSVDLDRLKQAFDQSVEAALPNVDFFALYTCQVVSQNADGTLDLQPNSASLPSQKNIPFRCGIPGVSITVQSGAQVLLGWENGSPSVPYCGLWLTGATGDLQSLTIAIAGALALNAQGNITIGEGASLAAARATDPVSVQLTLAEINEFVFTAPSGGGPCVVTGVPAVTLDGSITTGSSSVTIK